MKPASYQIEASQFLYERDHSMLFAATGTGKTLTYLLTLQDLIESGTIKRGLIGAPLRVVNNVWRQEAEKWGIHLSMALCTGEMTPARRAAAIASDTQALLVNYEMVPKVLDADHRCEAVYWDELSKLRSPTGKRQKAVRKAGFKIWAGGTGTPAPNGLTSLYGMANAVGLKMFGRNHDRWLRTYFYPLDRDERNWMPFKDTPTELASIIKPYTYVLEDDAVELPPIVRPPIEVTLPPMIRELYERFRAESALSDHDIVAGSAGVLRNKLLQISSGGFVYDNTGIPISFDPFRLHVLVDIVNEMNGKPIIIAYHYREQLAMMRRQWPDMPYIGGGSKDDDATIAKWNRREIPILGASPSAMGHGLNLQYGGNTIAWWSLPDDLELYLQMLGRLVRRDQPDAKVYSYEPVARNTVETVVQRRAHEKATTQDELWAALRR